MNFFGGTLPSELGLGSLVRSSGKLWGKKVDVGVARGGWTNYTYTIGVTLIILTCHLLNKLRCFPRLLSLYYSASVYDSNGQRGSAPLYSGSNPSAHISQSLLPQSRISTIISDLDLKNLIEDLDEKLHYSEKWEQVIDRREDIFSYTAKCCKQKVGPHKYISITVFENCSIEMLRDFYMDNDFRKTWDKTLAMYGQLQVDKGSGTEIGWMVKKFPLMTPREYVLAWKVWEGNDGSFYCYSKECEHPLIHRQKKYARVALFRSGWRIKAVSGRNACEIKMVHQEDSGMNVEIAKLAFSKGIWGYICKMHNALRNYSTARRSPLTAGVSAVTLIQKVPTELDAISSTANTMPPGTSTSRDHLHPGLPPHETFAKKLPSKQSIKLLKNAFLIIGGAICLSRGHSNLGVKVAMVCILGKLTKRSASRSNSQGRGGGIHSQD
ncbi:unnamed protein product [Cuscuta europaea]|uniref:START domain-containing protein n=1 Tax=Cuscuta europaea TaxID=41803 RepID=A0A9P0ZXM9_CUSEU|nr:unnamed protein product [Cuscuta europaea]